MKGDTTSYTCEIAVGKDTEIVNSCPASAEPALKKECAKGKNKMKYKKNTTATTGAKMIVSNSRMY